MSAESNFRELFCKMVEQFQLSPEKAQILLERILAILAGGDQGPIYQEESEEADIL